MKIWQTMMVAAVAGVGATSASLAAPTSPIAASALAAESAPLVHKAHGCHRSAQDSLEGWHRHVGPYCDWVRASRSRQGHYARCRTRCQYVGPIKTCKRVCH